MDVPERQVGMSAWWIGAVIGASLGLARVARRPATNLPASLDPSDWVGAARRSLELLRLWLIIGPVCFLGAFGLLTWVGPATAEVRHAAHVLGALPVVGLLSATALALCRVGDARRRTDDLTHQVVGWALVAAGGVVGGVVAGAIARALIAAV
jgi:hypothetical protein